MRCFSAVAKLLFIIILVVVGALGLFTVANKNNVAFPGARLVKPFLPFPWERQQNESGDRSRAHRPGITAYQTN